MNKPRVKASHLRLLLDSRSEDPVLYVDPEDGTLDVWASALVNHSQVVMHRHQAVLWLNGAEDDATLADLAEELQSTVEQIEI